MDAFGIASVFALLVMFVASLFIAFHYWNERRRRKHFSMLHQLERQAWRRHRFDSRTQTVALKKIKAKRTASLASRSRINPSPGPGNHPCS